MSRSASNSNNNSNRHSTPRNRANSQSNTSRPQTDHVDAVSHPHSARNTQSQSQGSDQRLNPVVDQARSPYLGEFELDRLVDASRPSTPRLVYIVTSNFVSQTTIDGVRLSESDIIGFQVLAVFARIEDANSYAEHECEEIDATVRRRRRRRMQGGAVGMQEGEGIRADVIVRDDGTVSWNVEDAGQIEVGQWVVQ